MGRARPGLRVRGPAVVAASIWLTAAVALRVASADTPSREGSDRPPSIVVIYTDDQREATLDRMPQTTSWLTRLPNGMVTNPTCCPSRASLLTGQWSHSNGVWRNKGEHGGWSAFRPLEGSTVATWLDAAGYRTALIGKYLNGYHGEIAAEHVPPGWDVWNAYLRAGYQADTWTMNVDGETILGDSYASHNLTERATGFISSTPTTDPLFLLLTPFVPHAPAVPEPAYERSFDHLEPHRNDAVNETDVTDKPKWVRQLPELTTSQLAAFDGRRERQFESLLSTDDLVDDVMTTLTDTGRLEDTLVVFMSDNGFLWNEHRIWGKGAAYDASARVPLAMYVPAALGEIRTPDDMILNIDIAPTAAALAGVAPSRPVDGESFLGRLDGTDASWRPTTIVEHASGGGPPAYCAARSAQGLFVHYDTGEEEFYDYRRDPLELRNRARASPPAMQPLESFARRTCGPGSDAEIPGFSW